MIRLAVAFLLLGLAVGAHANTAASADSAVVESIRLAHRLIAQGEFAQVRELLKEAAALNGHQRTGLAGALGKGLVACGAWPEAVQMLEEARAAGEALPDLPYYLAVAYFHVGRDAECAKLLAGATLASPEARAGGRYYLGLAYARLGRIAEARAQLLRRPETTAARARETRDINAFLED